MYQIRDSRIGGESTANSSLTAN